MAKVSSIMVIAMLMSLFAAACSKTGVIDDPAAYVVTSNKNTVTNDTTGTKNPSNTTSNIKHPEVQIEMQNGGKMVFELYPEYAPDTVNNFLNLAEKKFYDGLTFHRILKNFMIQGGDPKGNGTGGSDKTIKGEFAKNGYTKNKLKHTKGVISMARRDTDMNSASSQFFIVNDTTPTISDLLDGDYAAFGKLIKGEDVLDKISKTTVKSNPDNPIEMSKPTKAIKMKKVTIIQ
jgi:peptidylprolyl isomerase/peptidyl-prolyl cis-trans isomerase B (cyclophilin B)